MMELRFLAKIGGPSPHHLLRLQSVLVITWKQWLLVNCVCAVYSAGCHSRAVNPRVMKVHARLIGTLDRNREPSG